MITRLFVVVGAILETGGADLIGDDLVRIGGTSTIRMTVTVMPACALFIARRRNLRPIARGCEGGASFQLANCAIAGRRVRKRAIRSKWRKLPTRV